MYIKLKITITGIQITNKSLQRGKSCFSSLKINTRNKNTKINVYFMFIWNCFYITCSNFRKERFRVKRSALYVVIVLLIITRGGWLRYRNFQPVVRTKHILPLYELYAHKQTLSPFFFLTFNQLITYTAILTLLVTFIVALGVTRRCRLSWLTNSALVYEPKCGDRGEVAGSQPMSAAVNMSPNNSIFDLWRRIFNLVSLWWNQLVELHYAEDEMEDVYIEILF